MNIHSKKLLAAKLLVIKRVAADGSRNQQIEHPPFKMVAALDGGSLSGASTIQ